MLMYVFACRIFPEMVQDALAEHVLCMLYVYIYIYMCMLLDEGHISSLHDLLI